MDTMTEIKGGGMSVFTLEELEVLRDLVPLVRSGVNKRIEDLLDESIVWLSGNTIDTQAYKIDMCVKGSVCVLRMFVGSNFARFKIEYDHLVTTDTLSHFIDIWEEGIAQMKQIVYQN